MAGTRNLFLPVIMGAGSAAGKYDFMYDVGGWRVWQDRDRTNETVSQ